MNSMKSELLNVMKNIVDKIYHQKAKSSSPVPNRYGVSARKRRMQRNQSISLCVKKIKKIEQEDVASAEQEYKTQRRLYKEEQTLSAKRAVMVADRKRKARKVSKDGFSYYIDCEGFLSISGIENTFALDPLNDEDNGRYSEDIFPDHMKSVTDVIPKNRLFSEKQLKTILKTI